MSDATENNHPETDGMSREEKRERRIRQLKHAAVGLFVVYALLMLVWGAYDYAFVFRVSKGIKVVDGSAVRDHAPIFDHFFTNAKYEKLRPYLHYRHYVIPDGAEELKSSAFLGKNLRSVRIPDSVTKLDSGIFSGCVELEEVDLPDSVTEIRRKMFLNNHNLTRVRLPAGAKAIMDEAFRNCSGLREIVIPDGVEKIGSRAFFNCAALERVVIPESVKDIGPQAFYGCSSLRRLEIPDTVEHISGAAFRKCASLEEIRLPAGMVLARTERRARPAERRTTSGGLSGYAPDIPYTIPANPDIENSLFEDCTSLKKVVIPEGVRSIGVSSFARCTGLEEIILPESLQLICRNAFYGCTSLKKIVIPEGVVEIDTQAFADCTSLADVEFRSSSVNVSRTSFLGTLVPPETLQAVLK